jgi:hypothetical protein
MRLIQKWQAFAVVPSAVAPRNNCSDGKTLRLSCGREDSAGRYHVAEMA